METGKPTVSEDLIAEYIVAHRGQPVRHITHVGDHPFTIYHPALPIVLKDGMMMSVQAGPLLKSTPTTCEPPWTEYEVGYPSEIEPMLLPYLGTLQDGQTLGMKEALSGIYCHVPRDVLLRVIAKRGGIAGPANMDRWLTHTESTLTANSTWENDPSSMGMVIDFPVFPEIKEDVS